MATRAATDTPRLTACNHSTAAALALHPFGVHCRGRTRRSQGAHQCRICSSDLRRLRLYSEYVRRCSESRTSDRSCAAGADGPFTAIGVARRIYRFLSARELAIWSIFGSICGRGLQTVDYAQLDWLADSHTKVVAGRFILPFGLYSERLAPVWIRNLQDMPLIYSIGTHPYGAADGVMVRGVAASLPSASIQYSAFVSAHCSTNELQAVRAAGGDASVFVPSKRVETGLSYQRTLEGYQINNEAAYLSWQPVRASVDLKAEYDRNHYGDGYWIEAAHFPQQFFVAPDFFRHVQLVGRMEQFFVRNGGGSGLARVSEKRPEAGLNFQIRDDWRLESSYGRLLSQSGNSNTWNFGFTYRFVWPLWPGRKS